MNTELRGRCKKSRDLAQQFIYLLPRERPARKRFILARGSIAVAGHLHAGIVALAEQQQFTAAFVLLRSLFESGLTAWWLIYAAHTDDVKRIWEFQGAIPPDEDDVPGLKKKIDQLASRGPYPGAKNLAVLFDGPGAQGKWMHKLAHVSAPLVKLHDNAQAFSTEAMVSALNLADTFLALSVGAAVAMYDGTSDLEQFVIDTRQSLMSEQQGKTPADDPEPWRSHPCVLADSWDV